MKPSFCCLLLAFAACGGSTKTVREGQLLLYVDTDAPLALDAPARPGGLSPLFDRLRVDLFPPSAESPCATCTNEFEVDTALFEQRRASVGVAPPAGVDGYRARIRLFRSAFANGAGEPDLDATLDTTVALPAVRAGEITTIAVTLLTDDVGRPVGSLSAPATPSLGAPIRSLVGTWAGAQRVPCNGAPPPGAVCVPGGPYWMGTPNGATYAPERYFYRPRLVVLSPFFMSTTEVTVRDFRASGRTPREVWSGRSTGASSPDWCTFSTAPGAFEDYPVNCVSYADAHTYCASLGADLPTEAQFEYVASALDGSLFPWGQDEPDCQDAVFGRGGYGQLATALSPCKPKDPPGSPLPPGVGARDRLPLDGGVLVDLAGNLGEFTRDLWNGMDEPCWSRAGLYHDPWCTTVSPHDGPLVAYRGGSWVQMPGAMESPSRSPFDPASDAVNIGFRCVWPAH